MKYHNTKTELDGIKFDSKKENLSEYRLNMRRSAERNILRAKEKRQKVNALNELLSMLQILHTGILRIENMLLKIQKELKQRTT